MRTFQFFNAVDATSNQTSTSLSLKDNFSGQDMRWSIEIKMSGEDGSPHLFIEVSDDDVTYVPLRNIATGSVTNFFLIDEPPQRVRDSYYMEGFMRLRIEPNDNTTGTLSATVILKTKSN